MPKVYCLTRIFKGSQCNSYMGKKQKRHVKFFYTCTLKSFKLVVNASFFELISGQSSLFKTSENTRKPL